MDNTYVGTLIFCLMYLSLCVLNYTHESILGAVCASFVAGIYLHKAYMEFLNRER